MFRGFPRFCLDGTIKDSGAVCKGQSDSPRVFLKVGSQRLMLVFAQRQHEVPAAVLLKGFNEKVGEAVDTTRKHADKAGGNENFYTRPELPCGIRKNM